MQKETDMKYVVGIEYRKDDAAVELPIDLPSIVLPACNLVIQDIAYEKHLDAERLEEIITYSKSKKMIEVNGVIRQKLDLLRLFQ